MAKTPAPAWIRGMLTTRGQAFVAVGLTLLLSGLRIGFTDITRIGVLVCVLPLLAALSARGKGRRDSLVVTRSVQPAQLVVDQPADVTVTVQNTSARRTPLQLAEERVPHGLDRQPRFVLPAMEPGDTYELRYQIRCQIRGRCRLGPLTLRRQDPYGLARTATSLSEPTDLLVLPRIESLGTGRLNDSGGAGDRSIPHVLSVHDEDDLTVRSYRDGDDLRRIHWPTTAHRSELMVRQEDHPARRRAVIVLDSRAAGHQGYGATGSFEWAVSAAASIAAHLYERHYVLHLASSEIAAEGRAGQTLGVDDAGRSLAMARLGPSQLFDEVLHWAQPLTVSGGLVVAIVTDHDEAVVRRTAALRQPAETGLLILLDAASFAEPPRAAADKALALADLVAGTGWSTCVVGAGMSVAQAWSIVSARSALMARTGG